MVAGLIVLLTFLSGLLGHRAELRLQQLRQRLEAKLGRAVALGTLQALIS